jgi:hypothetical protein
MDRVARRDNHQRTENQNAGKKVKGQSLKHDTPAVGYEALVVGL